MNKKEILVNFKVLSLSGYTLKQDKSSISGTSIY